MKYVYFFGAKKAEGDGSMKDLLGGKGAGLAEMTRIGLPVPAGFTITTECCDYYLNHDLKYPKSLHAEVKKNLARLEKAGPEAGWKLPSVRSDLLTEEAERELHASAASAMKEVEQHKRSGRYREALQEIARLRPVVDRFFDEVMVMAEDEQVRMNRLTLLAGLLSEFSTIADFSEIVTAEPGK